MWHRGSRWNASSVVGAFAAPGDVDRQLSVAGRVREIGRAGWRSVILVLIACALAMAAKIPESHAQGIAQEIGSQLQIPDLPCMTPEERRQLQDLRNQDLLNGRRYASIEAQIPSEFIQAENLIRFYDRPTSPIFTTSDEYRAYERAKGVVSRHRAAVERLRQRQEEISRQSGELLARFRILVAMIQQRCYTPPSPIEPMSGPNIELAFSFGSSNPFSTSTYSSTGPQAPFNGDWSLTAFQVCGGATLWPGLAFGPARIGLDVNVCSGSNSLGSFDTTLFRIQRHGPGDVTLRASTSTTVDAVFKTEFAFVQTSLEAWYASFGMGPTFRQLDVTLVSDQSFFGGGIPSISNTTWQTGLGFSAGLSTFV